MTPRIRNAAIIAALALYWILLIQAVVGGLNAPAISWSPEIETLRRLIPLAVILAAAFAAWRVWRTFKVLVRYGARRWRHEFHRQDGSINRPKL